MTCQKIVIFRKKLKINYLKMARQPTLKVAAATRLGSCSWPNSINVTGANAPMRQWAFITGTRTSNKQARPQSQGQPKRQPQNDCWVHWEPIFHHPRNISGLAKIRGRAGKAALGKDLENGSQNSQSYSCSRTWNRLRDCLNLDGAAVWATTPSISATHFSGKVRRLLFSSKASSSRNFISRRYDCMPVFPLSYRRMPAK